MQSGQTDGMIDENEWQFVNRVATFTWLGDVDRLVARVYALAYTDDERLLLVGDSADLFWLPGGGVEDGESPEGALRRELMEEASATIGEMERLGVQEVEDRRRGHYYQAFYWCRICLEEDFVAEHEVTERLLVAPEEFLDTLFWGRSDPTAELLLETAANLNHAYRRGLRLSRHGDT